MLTNKKIIVLITIMSFFLTSCMSNNDKNQEVVNEEKNINTNIVNWEWKKGKSTWGEAMDNGTENSIYNWEASIPELEPKDIK